MRDKMREALIRAERKLSAYVGVCKGDKELTDAVLPMMREALAQAEQRGEVVANGRPMSYAEASLKLREIHRLRDLSELQIDAISVACHVLDAPPAPVVRDIPAWLWGWLMDYCKEQGTAPAYHDRLFRVVSDLRAVLAAAPTVAAPEVKPFATVDGAFLDRVLAAAPTVAAPEVKP